MKKLSSLFTLICCVTISAFSQVETVPAEYIVKPMSESKSEKILETIQRLFLEPIATNGWDEGVAAIKGVTVKGSKDQILLTEVYRILREDYHLSEFQDGGDLFLNVSAELGAGRANGVLPTIPTLKATPKNKKDPALIFAYYELPKGKTIKSRAKFDLLYAYDLNPNELHTVDADIAIPLSIRNKIKKNPEYLKRVFGLVLVQEPNAVAKVFVGNLSYLIIDGDFGPATLKTTGDIQNFLFGSDNGVSEVKAGQPMGRVASEDELVAVKQTGDNFLKAIRVNDAKGFKSAFGSQKVWTDATGHMDLKQYRKLPEYLSNRIQFEQSIVIEGHSDPLGVKITHPKVIADDVVINLENKTLVLLYRLPKGMKASKKRAITDIFNTKFYENPATQISNMFTGKGTTKANYISVILHKEKGTNNFNIGMPPSAKQ